MDAARARCRELFTGAGTSYGQWPPTNKPRTVKAAAGDEQWANHFDGIIGLGQVPVREDGTCLFAAIDIDVDTIDHAALARKVAALQLPLTVCRSKSGGAHCYFFMAPPGRPARSVRLLLAAWATAIGYANAEVFPKQDTINATTLGNWINLPYFHAAAPTRYAVDVTGQPLSLEAFVATVAPWPARSALPKGDERYAGIPPCLERLLIDGIGEGSRNLALFNYGIYFRKMDPDGWRQRLIAFNTDKLVPPLDKAELHATLKSVARKEYEYLCNQPPINAVCDKALCAQRKYGVGRGGSDDAGIEFDVLELGGLKKVLTEPPRWLLEVNGVELDLDTKQLSSFQAFDAVAMERLNLVLRPVKPLAWKTILKQKMNDIVEVGAPAEASIPGKVIERLHEFLEKRKRADSEEDLLKGIPWAQNGTVYFRAADFERHLRANQLTELWGPHLWTTLGRLGCAHKELTVKGQRVSVWCVPSGQLPKMEEPLTVKPPEEQGEF